MKKILLTGFIGLCLIFQVHAQERFKPTDESLEQYQYPEWFRDAKFGMWAHWGPQAVPRQGDWYARNMYIEGSAHNKYHVEHYGPPSKFGFKDIIPLWKAEKFDADKLMKLYKMAGAKYFVSMGSHHDNFFLWNSKIHKWNSVNMGPHRDIVGEWQAAAKKEGLKFGISEHLAASFNWYQPAHGADKTGVNRGVPYDGANPQYYDLYHQTADSANMKAWITNDPRWQREWLADITELIDLYHPDLLYSDSSLPFGDVGRTMLAHFYNSDRAKNSGKIEAVYTPKQPSGGKWVQDVERGVLDSISPFPWQTDTSIGDWFYKDGQKYKSSNEVMQLLLDVVSKNGNLLINVVQTPEGDLEADVLKIVSDIGLWTRANGEGVYSSRPWKVYGEGPSTVKANQQAGSFGGLSDTRGYQSSDFRFTSKNGIVYAYEMMPPDGDIQLKSLGKNASNLHNIASVTMLGSKEKLKWVQESEALVISKPSKLPPWKVIGYKIEFKN